ncbi:hypothetical protein FUA48_06265 [Flavobacterium alkalisoli]|uniref:Uncharacterized protein n=1 Tax=Flavobacterium alkalisoli TaxID=2602769 RepID=A0A5B9FWY3_9FLAO|nr:hypothetical protein [Flavobacterium alkalisoli]QEE49197.1 hypothetical protein FUA48_06265 [Flavobacterium alkalisoli]
MKKIFLTLLLLLSLIGYAQKPIYIQNMTSISASIYIEATGSQMPGCATKVSTTLTLLAGTSVSLNSFNSAPSNMWQLGGTTYTNAQATGMYGLAQWEYVRYDPLKCACGAFVSDNNVCYTFTNGNGYYNYAPCSQCISQCNDAPCQTYASWVDMGSYISVVFHN